MRLHLTDPALLRRLMKWAPEGGLSVRALAAKAGVSKTKISDLLRGGPYPTVDEDAAARIARAAGVIHVGTLFRPASSTSMDMDSRKDSDEPQ